MISLQVTIFTNPFASFCSVSACSKNSASFVQADLWAPCFIAATIRLIAHSSLHDTGHPFVAYLARSGSTGWSSEYVLGHIYPCLPIDSLISDASGMGYSLRTESSRNVSIYSGVAAIGGNFRHFSAVTTEAAYTYLFFCGGDSLCNIGSSCAGIFVCVHPLRTALVVPICLGKPSIV